LALAPDVPLDLAQAHEVDLHEQPRDTIDQPSAVRGLDEFGSLRLALGPFQILTVRISTKS
jgi:hypothetical protein